MSDPHTWQGVVEWGAIYTAVAWTIIFVIRLVIVAPFQMWREQKDRADSLEGLRQVANEASRPPSFEIGFEHTPFEPHEGISAFDFHTHRSLVRIWVENIEGRAIEDCRVVLENFGPSSPVKIGSMLLPDNRGSNEEKSARFDLASTEKRFFRFIDLDFFPGQAPDNRLEQYGYSKPGQEPSYHFYLRTEHEGTGYSWYLTAAATLNVGKQYFATIVVHGKKANSRRMDLTINVMNNGELRVAEANSTAAYRKEVLHERQNQKAI